MKLNIASRQSSLARIQAYKVADAIKTIKPTAEVQFHFSKSAGDKNQDILLTEFGDKGAFTEDFHQGLLDGEYDLVVHSWKDLPTEKRLGTEVVATLNREDARDLIYFKKQTLEDKPKKIKILSSSPRRAYNTEEFFKEYLPFDVEEVEYIPVRGNMPTRLKKLLNNNEADGLIVAKAAMDRLLSTEVEELQSTKKQIEQITSHFSFMVLPLSVNPAAAAQGALAIEINKNREDLKSLLVQINNIQDFNNVIKERKILANFGGGCHQKIGVSFLTRPYGQVKFLTGLTKAGEVLNEKAMLNPTRKRPVLLDDLCSAWPMDGTKISQFKRAAIALSEKQLSKIKSADVLRVARVNAWPAGLKPEKGQSIWVSGLKTWKKLAKLGLWVNGCDDDLGQNEPISLDTIKAKKQNWVKLTHNLSEYKDSDTVATYKLVEKDNKPIFGKKYYYWMSASTFKACVKLNPEIKNGTHFCGAGNTYEGLKAELGSADNIHIFLNYNEWKNWLEQKG